MSLKTQALEALKTKFDGIDEKVLSRIAAKVAKTAKDESEVTSQIEEMTLQGVIDAYTDSRVTEGSEKAIKTYEEKHGIKDGKVVKPDGEEGDSKKQKQGEDDETPAYVKQMLEQMNALNGEIQTLKAEKLTSTRQSHVDKLLENAPEELKKQILREYKRATFKDEDDFNEWIDEITPDIKKASETHQAQQTTGGKPKGGGGVATDVVNANVQARIDARKADTTASAIKGLSTSN